MLQFISAFDDVIIKRFDRGRSTTDKIQVKYVYAPKKRVLEDNKQIATHHFTSYIRITG